MEHMKLGILGSTGSIGTQALQVVDDLENISILSLTTNVNIALLENQIRKYKPQIAHVAKARFYKELKDNVKDTNTKIVTGDDGLLEASTVAGMDTLLTSIVGIAGLCPTLAAIDNKINIALANKETLVVAGDLVTQAAKKNQVKILPVDSEHGAIFQCLEGMHDKKELKKLILTASGGPFLGKTRADLQRVNSADALQHPNWVMGKKITIDSSTLMNKGLEVIEAKWLFDMEPNQIEVVVHPESIIHSMIEYVDHSVIAQLSEPDMRLPIQYALTYPKRYPLDTKPLDFSHLPRLTFTKPDMKTFLCLKLAYQAIEAGGTMPTVLNGANEACVDLFLKEKIDFLTIGELIKQCMQEHAVIKNPSLNDILNADQWARQRVFEYVKD